MPLVGKTPVLTARTFVAPRFRVQTPSNVINDFVFKASPPARFLTLASARLLLATFLSARTALSGTMQLFQVLLRAKIWITPPHHASCFHRVFRQSQCWIKFEHFGEQHCHRAWLFRCIHRLKCCHRAGCLIFVFNLHITFMSPWSRARY